MQQHPSDCAMCPARTALSASATLPHSYVPSGPPACGLCGGPNALSEAFVPEALSAREREGAQALIEGDTSPEREALAMPLCGECWPYGLEARLSPDGEREALMALIGRTGLGELQESSFSEALSYVLVPVSEAGAWSGTSRWRLDLEQIPRPYSTWGSHGARS